MYRRVLIPLDGSTRAEAILPEVERLTRDEAATVMLVRAIGAGDDEAAAAAYLTAKAERLDLLYGDVPACVRRGDAAEVVLDTAREQRADLIAMITHGYGGLTRWMYGGVTERVLHHSPVPVLAMTAGENGEPADAPARPRLRRILVPLDGSSAAERVMPHALKVAWKFDATLMLVHVLPRGSEADAAAIAESRDYLNRVAASAPEGTSVGLGVAHGDAAAEILRAADAGGADLIALTTHGHSADSQWRMGSVAERVLGAAGRPILLIRTPAAPMEWSRPLRGARERA